MFGYGLDRPGGLMWPEIELSAVLPVDQARVATVRAFLDTGASLTCLPHTVIQQLGSNLEYSLVDIASLHGTKSMRTYTLNLRMAGYEFSDMNVLAIDRSFALLGRDILNKLFICLNGPDLSWTIGQPQKHPQSIEPSSL